MTLKNQLIKSLKSGQIGVMPTDTIYGLVGLALNRRAVERIYKVRRRSPDKPLIILISSVDNLKLFKIRLKAAEKIFLNKFWPGQVSIILPCPSAKFKYLHRGTKTLAFRLPAKKSILEILRKTGPLVAPSANPEGLPPANNLLEAKNYFGVGADFYFGPHVSLRETLRASRGGLKSPPSTLIKLDNGHIEILRQGAVKVK